MRARHVFGMLALLGCSASFACLPEPTQDFEDYQTRARAFVEPTAGDGGATVEAGPPPTTATTGLYAASCLTELANGAVSKVFTFYTTTAFTPNTNPATGGQLGITLQAMALVNKKPPTVFSKKGTIGDPLTTISGPTDANGSFRDSLGASATVSFAGAANPISGSDVVLSNPGLAGRFATTNWCARLTGHVVQPAAASRDLDESKNFCIFEATKEGDPVPTHTFSDFTVANCPL